MNFKRRLLAMLGAFVVIFVADFVIHNLWLGEFYRAHAQWWRPEADMKAYMPFMLLSQIVLAWLLTVVYAKGHEEGKGGMGQGLRFGFLMGLLLLLPKSLMMHFVYPYPASLLLNWFLGGFVEVILASMVIGALYKPAE